MNAEVEQIIEFVKITAIAVKNWVVEEPLLAIATAIIIAMVACAGYDGITRSNAEAEAEAKEREYWAHKKSSDE